MGMKLPLTDRTSSLSLSQTKSGNPPISSLSLDGAGLRRSVLLLVCPRLNIFRFLVLCVVACTVQFIRLHGSIRYEHYALYHIIEQLKRNSTCLSVV